MVGLYNIYTDTPPPRARPGPSRPSSSSGGRCGGVTNPTTEHRDAVGRSEAQVGECIAHPGLSPGPINRRLRRRGHEVLFTPAQASMQHSRVVGWFEFAAEAVPSCEQQNGTVFFSVYSPFQRSAVSWRQEEQAPMVGCALNRGGLHLCRPFVGFSI